jgi:hypothetical protein
MKFSNRRALKRKARQENSALQKVFGLGGPIITVVQPTQSITGKHATRAYAANSVPRRSLAHVVRQNTVRLRNQQLAKYPQPGILL